MMQVRLVQLFWILLYVVMGIEDVISHCGNEEVRAQETRSVPFQRHHGDVCHALSALLNAGASGGSDGFFQLFVQLDEPCGAGVLDDGEAGTNVGGQDRGDGQIVLEHHQLPSPAVRLHIAATGEIPVERRVDQARTHDLTFMRRAVLLLLLQPGRAFWSMAFFCGC